MSDIVDYAAKELSLLLDSNNDQIQKDLNEGILEAIKVLTKRDFSRKSISYSTDIINRLCNRKPLTYIWGDPGEWEEVENGRFRNLRCPSIFKELNGPAYDTHAAVVSVDGGLTWQINELSRMEIDFPYIPPLDPERIYLELSDPQQLDMFGSGPLYEDITDNPERIAALRRKKEDEINEIGGNI